MEPCFRNGKSVVSIRFQGTGKVVVKVNWHKITVRLREREMKALYWFQHSIFTLRVYFRVLRITYPIC